MVFLVQFGIKINFVSLWKIYWCLLFQIALEENHVITCTKKMILEGEIKDAKLNSFPSDFQTLVKHLKFPLYFLYELLEVNIRTGSKVTNSRLPITRVF